MISADVRIQGFDARAFTNLVSLFAPHVVFRGERDPVESDAPEHTLEATPTREGDRDASDGSLVVVLSSKDRVLKGFHTIRGRVKDLPELERRLEHVESLPERSRAKRVIVLREGVLEDLFARASARMHREDDYVAQWLHVVRAIREEMEQGRITVHPRPFTSIPLPTSQLVRRTLDSVLPDDRSFVLAVWRGHALWTCAVLRRRAGEIDWIAGPDPLLSWTGPLGGDWRRDHRVVSQAVAAHVAPVHLGIYGDLRSIRRLLRSREAGAWAKAVASREVIVHPTPPYVAVAIGADAARRVAQKSSELLGPGLLGTLDPLRRLGPMLGALRGRVAEVASVTQALGFDPLKILAQFLERVDPHLDDDAEREVFGAAADLGGDLEPERLGYEVEDVVIERRSVTPLPYEETDAGRGREEDDLGLDDDEDDLDEEDDGDGRVTGPRAQLPRDRDEDEP